MDAIRLMTLTVCLLSAMLSGLYATSREQADPSVSATAMIAEREPAAEPIAEAAPTPSPEDALPRGIDVPEALLADAEVFVDAATGVRMGPLAIVPRPARARVSTEAIAARPVVARPRRATARPLDLPRLDANPGRHVLLTARGMIARNETVRGSCYAYLTEVFDRAGHEGWRTRTIVHQAGASGPYADLDRIQPGDWLYIVNNPDSTPVGTHSVLFVGWEDRANGYARTISHAGWAAGASPGREGSHDVSRTYRIIRPRLAE